MSLTIGQKRRIILRELHSLQVQQAHCARLFGVSRPYVSVLAQSVGLKFSKTWGRKLDESDQRRLEEMAALYKAGYTLESIAAGRG